MVGGISLLNMFCCCVFSLLISHHGTRTSASLDRENMGYGGKKTVERIQTNKQKMSKIKNIPFAYEQTDR